MRRLQKTGERKTKPFVKVLERGLSLFADGDVAFDFVGRERPSE